ncbi:ras GTPase-activating protein nGAP isoform X1 [Lates japonicus]
MPPPEGCEGPVQGPRQASYHWQHYRKPWQRSDPQPAPKQLLDRYKWRTSARLAPRASKMSPTPEGGGHGAEPLHLRLLSLPRFGTVRDHRAHEGPARPGSLRRIFFRSMSEPGTGGGPERAALRKVGSDAERRAPSVSSFIQSFSRRISRVLRDEPETDGGESGRRDFPGFMWWSQYINEITV